MTSLFERSGIDSRAMAIVESGRQAFYNGVPPGTDDRMRAFHRLAPALAQGACERALEQADVRASSITHLVTASCTGLASPGVDIALIRSLGLCESTQRVNIGFMGCHAALNALRTARALALAEADARVLVCCVELCSLHMQASQPGGSIVADALFADGAAACVVSSSEQGGAPVLRRTASTLLPESLDEMGWSIGQGGFTMTLSPAVPGILAANVRPWVASVLQKDGLDVGAVPSWAIHPGGPRVLQSVAEALGVPASATLASAEVLRAHGNMSSATVLFIIEAMLRERSPLPMMALAFGPGLTGEAMLLD